MTLPVNAGDGRYHFSRFDEFLTLYEQVGHVVRSAQDLSDIALAYLRKVSAQGSCYVEFMISPAHSIANGIQFESQISALSDAFGIAKEEFGMLGSIIVTCVRHRGPDEAIEVAEMTSRHPHSHLRGFGLAGDEHRFDIEEFKGAFMVAQDAELGLTAHVGEWGDANEVLKAVNTLNLQRVGHGISVSDEPAIMSELLERRVGFEVCLSSNVKLGASPSIDGHQVRKMLDAECLVTFSTDDPAYFDTTPKKELSLATQHFSLSPSQKTKIFQDSVDMAFCDEWTKKQLLEQATHLLS